MDNLYNNRLAQLRLLEQKIELQTGLPHLYGYKFYPWAREFFESRHKEAFLSAANQISKSSTQIRKDIHWSTAMDLWPSLWNTRPRQFWYLYPTRDVAHIEFKKKWEPEFLPRGDFKSHPVFGWKAEIYHSRIFAIHFNSDVSIYFKTYAQDVQDLQTGTCHKVSLDEEPPEEIMGEIAMRLAATDGYLSGVFTPTIGQEYWRETMEVKGPKERYPGAWKRQISMYDCLQYEDGTPSPWTLEKINRARNACKSDAEVQRRVYGRFVPDEGLKYPSFSRDRNVKPAHPLPKGWWHFVGVDPGSGGENHPAAIAVVAVSPDFKMGRIIRGWRGDAGSETTAGDVVRKVVELTKDIPQPQIFYDYSSRDFFNIASSMGLMVQPAEKSHAVGEQLLNVLFKNEMLIGYDLPELDGLYVELTTLKIKTLKTKAKDDFIDAVRYAISRVPWNLDDIRTDIALDEPKEELSAEQSELKDRRNFVASGLEEPNVGSFEGEFESWNELLENF